MRSARHLAGAALVLTVAVGGGGCAADAGLTVPQASSAAGEADRTGTPTTAEPGASTGRWTTSTTGRPATTSTTRSTTTTAPATTVPSPTTATTLTTPAPTVPPTTAAPVRTQLAPGDEGEDVRALQVRLGALRYWNGEPDGRYGGLTEQAVMAFQKVHAMTVDGVASPQVLASLANPLPLVASQPDPDHVEVDKTRQLLWVVRGGQVQFVLNASTGSGETYYSPGRQSASVAVTPNGHYQVFREVDGPDSGPLGTLYRPKYFNGGIAVHGYSSVPALAASHGCVRFSNPAMDLLWTADLLPSGALVIVTGEGA